jgi:predicted transcriptional regulator
MSPLTLGTVTAREGTPCPRCYGTGVLPDDRAIGVQMRERRQRAGLTLRALARKLNLTAAYLSDLELGRRYWNATNVKRYEEAL